MVESEHLAATTSNGAAMPARDLPNEVEYRYVKSPLFRVIIVDGGIGGPDARGRVSMAIYSEHRNVPETAYHAVTPEGNQGDELLAKRKGGGGFIREVEAQLVMSPAQAEHIAKWLLEQADILRGAMGGAQGEPDPRAVGTEGRSE
jgi:hypothetical protein